MACAGSGNGFSEGDDGGNDDNSMCGAADGVRIGVAEHEGGLEEEEADGPDGGGRDQMRVTRFW